MIKKNNHKIVREIVKFAYEIHKNDKGWKDRMVFISPFGIAKMYFKEFVNQEDWKRSEK